MRQIRGNPIGLPIPTSDGAELSQLSFAQLLYLRALLKGKKVTAAASEASVTKQTAYRWQADPQFMESG